MNPRYLAYCAAHDTLDPDAMLETDRIRWPGGIMCGFMLWVRDQWAAWYEETGEKPEHRDVPSPRQHAAFDAWLSVRYGTQAELFA